MFISVLLPAPFSPSSAWTSPARRSKSTWSLATTPGNALTMPRASRAGAATGAAVSRCAGVGVIGTRGRGPRATARGPVDSMPSYVERRQLDRDAVGPPVHAGLALVAGGAGRELVEVGLLELRAGRQELLAGVVLDRPGEDVEPAERAGQHLGQRVLDLLDVRRRQVGDALAAASGRP